MKKALETLGGLLIIGGGAGLAHLVFGWAPFGVVVRVAEATPFVRDHATVTYVVAVVLGLVVLVLSDVADKDEKAAEPDAG